MVVEVDAGAEREQADGDSGAQVGVCSGAVSFEAEEVFAGLEDAFDALSDIESRRVVVGSSRREGRMICAPSWPAACSKSRPA